MDRRSFLTSLGVLVVAPEVLANGAPTMRSIDMRFVESLGRWVPEKWLYQAIMVASSIGYDLAKHKQHITVWYDVISWRTMEHNWIGMCQNGGTQCSIPIKEVETTKLMCMDGTIVDYPKQKHHNDLMQYGHTIAHIVEEKLERLSCL